jgi:hypothetical protein
VTLATDVEVFVSCVEITQRRKIIVNNCNYV